MTDKSSETDKVSVGGDSDTGTDLARIEKYLQRILNSGMIVSNTVKEMRADSEATIEKLRSFIVSVLQAGERREAKIQATFDAFQQAFRDEIGSLRNDLSKKLQEKASLEAAGSWLSLLDDIDTLIRSAQEQHDASSVAWSKSIQVLAGSVIGFLERAGFSQQEIVPGKTRFDPEQHQSVAPASVDEVARVEELEPGVIVALHDRGFLYRDQLYRQARVFVSPQRVLDAHENNEESNLKIVEKHDE